LPEGHTLHHHARKHQRWFAGQLLRASSPQGRFSEGAAQLDGQVLSEASAKGKHLFWSFADVGVLHVHLGLYGRFRYHRAPVPEPRGAVRLRVVGDARGLDLIGPTRCRLLTPGEAAAQRDKLGEDPLDAAADGQEVVARLQRTRRAIGATLLDQSIVAGIGNVYRAELLFLAQLHPATPSKEVPETTLRKLWDDAVTLLAVGAKANSIRVVGEDVQGPPGSADVEPGDFEVRGRYGPRADRLWVYKRRACKLCGSEIVTSEVASRTMYHCPGCQPAR